MYSKSYCAALQGIEGRIIHIEADISDGLPYFSLVGYLSSEVKEARERVRVALRNAGYHFAPKKITVNLSPANIRKEGTGYDLAIAVAVLAAYGYIPDDNLKDTLLIGELGLDGSIKPVKGVLPMAYTGWEHHIRHCILPIDNISEGRVIPDLHVIGVSSLKEVVEMLSGNLDEVKTPVNEKEEEITVEDNGLDFSDIYGQSVVRRAVEVAVSGMHNLMMIGPPGSGKTMIAKRVAGIMPTLTFEEQMEISKIYSVAGLLNRDMPLVNCRPFRAPHHTITQTALVGGGREPMPGEISLASGGVLFLDELPEFARASIEVLRQPLEDGWVNVSRLQASCRYPAHSLLLTALNPCHCGYFPDRTRCQCTTQQVKTYLGKISRPLLDRIDICTETIPVRYEEMESVSVQDEVEDTAAIRQRIERIHQLQRRRYEKEDILYNSQLSSSQVKKYCTLDPEASEYMKEIFDKMTFSARAYHKILKVGRTIADMEDSDNIQRRHLSEAVCYRAADQKYWGMGD